METKGFYKTPNVFSSPEDHPLLIMNIRNRTRKLQKVV